MPSIVPLVTVTPESNFNFSNPACAQGMLGVFGVAVGGGVSIQQHKKGQNLQQIHQQELVKTSTQLQNYRNLPATISKLTDQHSQAKRAENLSDIENFEKSQTRDANARMAAIRSSGRTMWGAAIVGAGALLWAASQVPACLKR